MSRKYLSCAETAKLVRSALSESFPSIKFSVRSSVYSGGASIDVRWLDGPTSAQVKQITNQFEGSYFDGMIDYKGSIYHKLDGQEVRFGANFIFENRDYSDALVQRAIDEIVTGYGGCEPISIEDYRQGRAYNWRNSGGCDLGRALQCWLSGNNAGADWITPDQGMTAQPSKTLARVAFASSDEYGAPYGSNGYPRAA
jgi:hypothetical protein